MNSFYLDINNKIKLRTDNGLFRTLKNVTRRDGKLIEVDGKICIDFCSNDYLGFANDPILQVGAEKALKKWGAGAAASRLISGNISIFGKLEKVIAEWKQTEDALVFASGYMANVGTISALLDENDTVVLDRLSHASLIDGARLSKATLKVFPHNDTEKLDEILKKINSENGKVLVATESVFSMDGDKAPLSDLVDCCKKNNALLLVDEAHALGVYGNGRGCVTEAGLSDEVDIVIGTLSKAIGSQGGFVACKKIIKDFLINNSRSFIYSTGLAPAAAGAALAAFVNLNTELSRIDRLWYNIKSFRKSCETDRSCIKIAGDGPICSVIIGSAKKAVKLSEILFENGFLVPAIRPPTVPKGTSRIRITISATHTDEQLKKLAEILKLEIRN